MADQRDYTNHLAGQTSPYLLQHLHNPVDWYPWGPEALALARREDKPILLSIGYSACHWCHVMAHECFEDPEVAEVMNRLFVNIKVDREERPDLDRIYQTAHSLLAQRAGGWPLTVFLMPEDQTPFFAGTYFPKEPRHGLPGFVDLLQRVAGFYRERRADLEEQNHSVRAALARLAAPPVPAEARLDPMPLDLARNQLGQQFDPAHGGFGRAPKFPHPANLERLLRHWLRSRRAGQPDQGALDMLGLTLTRMAEGGLFDQVGGGFCRYSTDDQWMIPHFEKMLYDNGLLLAVYAQAHAATGVGDFARTAIATGEWVLREMQSPGGGYWSSLDADSEGEEGRFYCWTPDEVRGLLDDSEYDLFARRYGLDREPNFEGKWYPHGYLGVEAVADALELEITEARERLEQARRKLYQARTQRVWPGRDDKILTAWNALMIRGMAIAARLLGRDDFGESARRALDFLRARLWRDGRLLATCKDGHAHLDAYLDDHAYLIDAILELLAWRWRDGDLDFAVEVAEVLLAHFSDPAGGFFFTADDHERLVQRPKPAHDDALPSGNGIAAQALLRLGHLLGETRYIEAAEGTLRALWGVIEESPWACGSLLDALELALEPGPTVIVRGREAELAPWRAALQADPDPRRLALFIPPEARLPPALAERSARETPVAWLCEGMTCQPPLDTPEALREALGHMGDEADTSTT